MEEQIPRNADVEKLKDPEFSKKVDWINALERDFPQLPNYFADLIVSYCMNNPEEAEKANAAAKERAEAAAKAAAKAAEAAKAVEAAKEAAKQKKAAAAASTTNAYY